MTLTKDNIAIIPVLDFMTRNVITIPENRTMKQASKLMYEDNIGSIVILKEGSGSNLDGNVSGSTTERVRNTNRDRYRERYCQDSGIRSQAFHFWRYSSLGNYE